MATHELAREPHPPGQSATPRLQPKQPAQPAGFMSAREPGDGDEDGRLPDLHARTPSAVLESVSEGVQDDGGAELRSSEHDRHGDERHEPRPHEDVDRRLRERDCGWADPNEQHYWVHDDDADDTCCFPPPS